MAQFSLVDLSALSKPAVILIEKISGAIGWMAAPRQIKRIAKAEAAASRITAESEIQNNELRIRAERRWEFENIQHQKNLESVVQKALLK